MKRRAFLALAGSGLLAGCDLSAEQGFFNKCDGPALKEAGKVLFEAAVKDLRLDQVWDMHAHLFGHAQGGQELYLNPKLDKPLWPEYIARRVFFLNAGCVPSDEADINGVMVRRLASLAGELKGAKVMVLAFDYTRTESGEENRKDTTFAVSNEYAMAMAKANPKVFEWIASIHPYDPKAVERLHAAHAGGARAVKWLPPSQHMDPSSDKCDKFYEALVKLDMPLITHTGDEHAVVGEVIQVLGNPILLHRPLKKGVRVIAAHCATLGEWNFEAFSEIMKIREFQGRFFGDISAVTQINRAKYLPTLLRNEHWHSRLLNGSDYPLPGVMPIFSLKGLVSLGVLDESLVPALRELREVNPLAFDLTLKRNLRIDGKRFPASIFETRPFFERPRPT